VQVDCEKNNCVAIIYVRLSHCLKMKTLEDVFVSSAVSTYVVRSKEQNR